jgi:hypothetical protein
MKTTMVRSNEIFNLNEKHVNIMMKKENLLD